MEATTWAERVRSALSRKPDLISPEAIIDGRHQSMSAERVEESEEEGAESLSSRQKEPAPMNDRANIGSHPPETIVS